MVQYFEGRDGLGASDLGQSGYDLYEMASQSSYAFGPTSEPPLIATPSLDRKKEKVNLSQAFVNMGESLKDGLVALANADSKRQDTEYSSMLQETNKTMSKLNENLENFSDAFTNFVNHMNKNV
ncbi:hypothetical protein ROZALSC1DRAFT_25483 [Rozella allomycis CSF55]|uniref:Uncharacterized protein n=1 Tax=Rozella allomycis (strain CSF55) TaxID=988480 RepID=A0A4P9YCE0_ROZAC|nr:hypothetical protein ROZALSC1DRAFT_25483 [Rozella allomycis CSF55]